LEQDDEYASGFHDHGEDTMMDWADNANDVDADSPPNQEHDTANATNEAASDSAVSPPSAKKAPTSSTTNADV
jgi:hypothetical protein